MPKVPFFGPSYTLDSVNAECQSTKNLIPEVIESQQGKAIGRMRRTPGLNAYITLPKSPLRGLWCGEGVMYAVAGDSFYQIFADNAGQVGAGPSYTDRTVPGFKNASGIGPNGGSIGNDNKPVQILVNGQQLMIVSAGYVHVDSGNGPVAMQYPPETYTDIVVGWAGTVDSVHAGGGGHLLYYTINLKSGTPFTQAMVGGPATINGVGGYTIINVSSETSLQVTPSAPAGTDLTFVADAQAGGGYTAATLIQSPSAKFTALDVGANLSFQADGTFAATTATIVSVDIFGYAILSLSPAPAGSQNGNATKTGINVAAGTGAMLDEYAIVSPPSSKNVYISAINDFTTWSLLDVAVKEGYPDNILYLLADHQELYLFGELEESEIWQDTGNANFPFERMPGGVMHFGLAAKYSPVRLGFSGVAWLSYAINRGAPVAVYAESFVPKRISTHAVEQVWRSYPTVSDAVAYSEMEDGHDFWVIHFPTADATWVYDLTASTQLGQPVWTERYQCQSDGAGGVVRDGNGNPVLHVQSARMCHTYGALANDATGAHHFVGDGSYSGFGIAANEGKIYIQSFAYYTDNGVPIMRQRTFPHLAQENRRIFASALQLMATVGVNDLAVTLDYSRDFGHTFINAITLTAAAANGYVQRLLWRRLGKARDLVLRLTTLSQGEVDFEDAYLTTRQGRT